jgi:hypothetical protein
MFLDECVHSAPLHLCAKIRHAGGRAVNWHSLCDLGIRLPKGHRGTHPAIVLEILPIYHLRTAVLRLLLGREADDTEVVPPAVDNVARVSALLSRFPISRSRPLLIAFHGHLKL